MQSLSESSRNQWPKFVFPRKDHLSDWLMKELFFLKLVHKINLIPPMLEGNVFCVLYSRSFVLLLVIYHLSCYNFCFFVKLNFSGQNCKNCSEIDWTLSFNSFIWRNQNKFQLSSKCIKDKGKLLWGGWEWASTSYM